VAFVSAISLRRRIARGRRHISVLMAVLALGAAVAVHHDGVAMGDMGSHQGMSLALEICLGVMTAVGTALAAVTFGVLALARPQQRWFRIPAAPVVRARPPVPRARAGPPLLCLLCVSRR